MHKTTMKGRMSDRYWNEVLYIPLCVITQLEQVWLTMTNQTSIKDNSDQA